MNVKKKIKKYLASKKQEEKEVKDKQDKCDHQFFEIPVKILVKQHFNLLNFLFGGVAVVQIHSKVFKCCKCEKEINVEFED
jgi:hypothetical protein